MKKFKDYSLQDYLKSVSKKQPVPGGGSVAALTGALGVSLLCMVTNYSIGKNHSKAIDARLKKILKQLEIIMDRFITLIDLDAKAYLEVVKTRQAPAGVKREALKQARAIPFEVCRLSYKAVQLTPFLVLHGNKYLISDVKVALELLLAAYNSGKINVEINK